MATASIKAVVTAEDKATPTINSVSKATENLGNSIKSANSAAESSSGSFGSLASAFAVGTVAANAFTAVLSKVGGVIKSAFSSASDFEQYRIAFETMLGSADAARNMLANLSDFAQRTPFELPQVVEGAKQLLAYGISAQDILPDFEALGNIAAGVGNDKLPFLTLAFGQVATKGKLAGQEIRQFTEAGVPLVQQLAKTFNTTTSNIQALSEQGKISFDDVRQAIVAMSSEGGKFFNLMQKQSTTFGGVANNIVDQVGRIARSIMGINAQGDIAKNSPFDKLKDSAQGFYSFLQNNSNAITASFQIVGAAIAAIANGITAVFQVIPPGFILATGGALLFGKGLASLASVAKNAVVGIYELATAMTVFDALLLVAAVAVGSILYKSFSETNKKIGEQSQNLSNNSEETKQAANKTSQLAATQDDLGKKIQKVNDDIAKENRTFAESMAQMVKDAQDKVKSIQLSMDDENQSFKDAQEQAIGDHNDRVQKIQGQINQEKNLGILADQAKLASYQSELAKENAEYDKQQAKDLADHNKKIADEQAQMDAETALLQKHSADINAVRDVQLLDEFDALKRSHKEQLDAYATQKADIVQNATDTSTGIVKAFNDQQSQVNAAGATLGTQFAEGFKTALSGEAKKTGLGLVRFFEASGRAVPKLFGRGNTGGTGGKDGGFSDIFQQAWNESDAGGSSVGSGNATGTDSWRGGKTWVGEQGPEVLDLPQGSKITPNNKLSGVNSSAPINVTINTQAFAGSQMEARKFATLLMNAFNDAQSAKGLMV